MKKDIKISKITSVLKNTKLILVISALMLSLMSNTVFAADPLVTINNLSDFTYAIYFSLLK